MSFRTPIDVDEFLLRKDISDAAKERVLAILLRTKSKDSDEISGIYRQAQAQVLIELAKSGDKEVQMLLAESTLREDNKQ